MGVKNRITEEKYNQIKRTVLELRGQGYAVGAIDQLVTEKHGIGTTTARYVRRSANYGHYRGWTAKGGRQLRYKPDPEAMHRLQVRRAAMREDYFKGMLLLGILGVVLVAVFTALVVMILKLVGAIK